ncbi:MAG: pyrophosphate--fructose-6-phosphate 1-phosphotransferase [Elusimicrobia bacterium RIFCSPLOWO2_02_FULL_39_32]|nr:MAG: pyrophosphate--fructose-6-phosphate 1-phosphotransferase [Elusimicrobia bacterium GWA2_38_7]OGR80627.1 MAG: pyrophosphate--fructose-6-phosphate 1-phosphotransferase [Elusimicrobia bacterium RIFCSPHIGHO2_02_FULL_39_36]OGR91476.1 MAG: pyrophosphate--fructose-6-phosphate 1-phosphotransferase [Elusimicrobia bacterium RIFCSPLOWO2_02_FULL_39_32]OGS00731.1 MAG: pyrophosphate--fructose-6-phosphate 1-phosphotransferase [Elusimicrobia bacterium RIFCSPLOWO2_12_FULL_39_28]
MAKKIGILTGGGDCPGLNPAIRGCVLRAQDHGFECIGLLEGWKGLVEGKSMPLGLEDVTEIVNKGGTILGTSRTNPFKKENGVKNCLDNFKKLGLDALVAMGGEDTLGVAGKFYKEHQVPVVGVPKTMDNDLSVTDYTFGFDTATTVAVDAAERLRDTGRSHRRIMVLEVMGRHAGWVALFTAVASGADWVCLPEEPVELEAMCSHLKKIHAKRKVALVIASEAVTIPGEDAGKEELDDFGHMLLKKRGVGERLSELIEKETKIETRAAVIGHIQRGGAPTLFDRILGLRVGVKAADLVAQKSFGQMVALKGNEVVGVSLEEATKELKVVPQDWLKFAKIFFK